MSTTSVNAATANQIIVKEVDGVHTESSEEDGIFQINTLQNENVVNLNYQLSEVAVMEVTEKIDVDSIEWDERKENIKLPKSYSSVDQGITTPVQDQGSYNTCWAHTAKALLEIGMLRNGLAQEIGKNKDTLSISLTHGMYYAHRPVADSLELFSDDISAATSDKSGSSILDKGGHPTIYGNSVLAWMGPVLSDSFISTGDMESTYYSIEESDALATYQKAYGNRVATVTSVIQYDVTERMISKEQF